MDLKKLKALCDLWEQRSRNYYIAAKHENLQIEARRIESIAAECYECAQELRRALKSLK
ncbi:hypothetical protein NTGM5_480061 [Candidatus Nitrotoga sp. M5]|nr:hypothetical protein NTGM5_480061 [Candidatus Nitrotoga sp. M5]